MQLFADIHLHTLSDVDDGPENDNGMYELIDREYEIGCRTVCVTPHFNPMLFGNNTAKRDQAFQKLISYVKDKNYDLKVFCANELRYYEGCLNAIEEGKCLTLSDSRYLLVDFDYGAALFDIKSALLRILRAGYIPVLAHFELYYDVRKSLKTLIDFKENGVVLQCDADSLLGINGRKAASFAKKAIKKGLVDVISSDAHNLSSRKPMLVECASYITKKFGVSTTNRLMYDNPIRILNDGFL